MAQLLLHEVNFGAWLRAFFTELDRHMKPNSSHEIHSIGVDGDKNILLSIADWQGRPAPIAGRPWVRRRIVRLIADDFCKPPGQLACEIAQMVTQGDLDGL